MVAGVVLAGAGHLRLRRSGRIRIAATTSVTSSIANLQKVLPEFDRELRRARRYRRPATLLALGVDGGEAEAMAHEVATGGTAARLRLVHMQTRQVLNARLAAILSAHLREGDIAAFDAKREQFLVLLPEALASNALCMAARIDTAMREAAGVKLVIGTAQFPADELAIATMLDRVTSQNIGVLRLEPSDSTAFRHRTIGGERAVHEGAGAS
jgi:GGDEF domain-containing protein